MWSNGCDDGQVVAGDVVDYEMCWCWWQVFIGTLGSGWMWVAGAAVVDMGYLAMMIKFIFYRFVFNP